MAISSMIIAMAFNDNNYGSGNSVQRPMTMAAM